MVPSKDIVKVAIKMPKAYPQLIELDQKKALAAVIKDVCEEWNVPAAHNYALQYAEGCTYITESNRLDIKNGSILHLVKAPRCYAEELYWGMESIEDSVCCDSLQQLAVASSDITFAGEFISRDGHKLLIHTMQEGGLSPVAVSHALTACSELMEHGIICWESLKADFLGKVIGLALGAQSAESADTEPLALAMLENMLLSGSSALLLQVKQKLSLEALLGRLQVTNLKVQTRQVALLVALLQAAGDTDRQELLALLEKANFRQIIYKSLILSSVCMEEEEEAEEMSHSLYLLQTFSLSIVEARMKTPVDPSSKEQEAVLKTLWKLVFEAGDENIVGLRSPPTLEFQKMGFSDNNNPCEDLLLTPPGILSLDAMAYFSRSHPDAYVRFVLENSSGEDTHRCPFARSSIQLTLMLCEILHVGEQPTDTSCDYNPLCFSQDQPLEELFCVCIQLLNKTWKEMRASQEDFDKVMQVVREQITRTLTCRPTSLELFKSKVNTLSYSEILKLRQMERLHQEETLAKPVLELREHLKPKMMGLVRQQRLNRLCHGTLFRKTGNRRRQEKQWFCRLSPNHKVLHFGEVENGEEPPAPEALQEISVTDISTLLTGRDCPHMKEIKGRHNKEVLELAFSIVYTEENLNLIANNRSDFCLWMDSLNLLLGQEMTSEYMHSELEVLLSMEVKLCLLDLDSISIPDAPPPVPEPPSNFDFHYDFSEIEL